MDFSWNGYEMPFFNLFWFILVWSLICYILGLLHHLLSWFHLIGKSFLTTLLGGNVCLWLEICFLYAAEGWIWFSNLFCKPVHFIITKDSWHWEILMSIVCWFLLVLYFLVLVLLCVYYHPFFFSCLVKRFECSFLSLVRVFLPLIFVWLNSWICIAYIFFVME